MQFNYDCLELDETNAQQQLDSTRGPRRMAGRSGEAECGAGNAVHILARFIRDRRGRELLSEKDWRYLAVFIWSLFAEDPCTFVKKQWHHGEGGALR